jgi:hypothetical protein
MIFWYLIVFIVALVLSVALAPKPQGPRAALLDDFSFPTAEEGRPIPVVFGTVDITGPNVLWYGDLSTGKIKKHSLFGSSVIGYKYYIGFHLGLCYGPADAITKVVWGDKTAWTGNITVNGSDTINLPDLFGGEQREGGISGSFDVAFGADDQTANDYLAAKIGLVIPAYRGIVSFIWKTGTQPGPVGAFGAPSLIKSGYIGNTAYPKPVGVRVTRILKGWQGATWYPSKAVVDTTSMNPAHIIYQALTDTEWGMGVSLSFIDDAAFRTAADIFYTEGFGLSLMWNQEATIEDFVQTILNHCAASLVLRQDTQQYQLVPIRGGYDVGDLEVYTPADIISMDDFQRQGWGETVNEVSLTYTDPDTGKDTVITQQDLGNITAQGRRIPTPVELKGIRNNIIAQQVLSRELQTRSTPVAKGKFTIKTRAWAVPFGQVFALTWPSRQMEAVPSRVTGISRGSLKDNTIQIDWIEDVFALGLTAYLSPVTQQPQPPPLGAPPPNSEGSGATVISSTQTAPPTNPHDGDAYLVPNDATDIWAGHGGQVAIWNEDEQRYDFVTVPDGTLIFDSGQGGYVTSVGGSVGAPNFGANDVDARHVSYDDTNTSLGADNVQAAIEALMAQGSESAITVRAFVNGLFRAQTANLTLYDSPDGEVYTSRSTKGQTSLSSIIATGTGASVVYHAIRSNQAGSTAIAGATSIYGDWDWVDVSPVGTPLAGRRYFAETDKHVAWDVTGTIYVFDSVHSTWSPPGASTSYGSAIVPDAPVTWLRMGDDGGQNHDSGSGHNACDFSPKSGGEIGTGISPNKPGLVGEGKSVQCTGLTYVELFDSGGGVVNIFQGAQSFTMEMWIKKYSAPPGATCVLFSVNRLMNPSGSVAPVLLQWDPAAKTFNLQTWSLTLGGTSPAKERDLTSGAVSDIFDGGPHHIAITRNGSTGKLCIYLDGALAIEEATGTVTDLGSGAPLAPAGTIWGNVFNKGAPYYGSYVDEFACYSTALSAARIAAHYAEGADGVSAGFLVKEMFYDTPNIQYLIFGEVQDDLGSDVIETRPKLYTSPNLIDFNIKSSIAETPETDNMAIQQVAWQHAAEQVPAGAQPLLQRSFDVGDNAEAQATYHFKQVISGDDCSLYFISGSTFNVRVFPYFDGDFADQLGFGYTSPSGHDFHGGVIRIGDLFYAAGVTQLTVIDVTNGPRNGEQYTGLGNIYDVVTPSGRIFCTGNAVGDVTSHFIVELDPADVTGAELQKHSTSTQQTGGTGGLLSADNSYVYSTSCPTHPTDGITRWDTTTGAESTIQLTGMIAGEEKGYCTIIGSWIYRLWRFNRGGDGDCRVSRNKLSDGSPDPDGDIVTGLDPDFLQGTNIAPPIYEGRYLCYNRKLLIDTTSDATIADLKIYFQNVMAVALRKFNGGGDVAKFSYSTDGGATWVFPAIVFPTSSPAYGVDGCIWNGEKFVISGRGWSGVSTATPPATFDFSDPGTSGIPETSRLVLFGDGHRRMVAAVRGDYGVRGSLFSDDGLVWVKGPEIKAKASEVVYDDTVTLYGHSDVQGVLEDIKTILDSLISPPASSVTYDHTTSGLAATNVQTGIDELKTDINTVQSAVTALIATKGQPSGIASLDGSGTVPIAQLPSSITGAVSYQGTWNANTNSPDLGASSPVKGYYYVVATAGATSLGGITDWKIKDWAIYNGSTWEKVDNTEDVTSVAGRTGAIVLTSGDLSDLGAASGAAQLDAGGRIPISEQTLVTTLSETGTAFNLSASDAQKVTECANAAAQALTVQTNATVAVDVGQVFGYVQAGAGALSVVAAGGVTINVPSGRIAQARTQYSLICLHKIGTNEWNLYGDLHA